MPAQSLDHQVQPDQLSALRSRSSHCRGRWCDLRGSPAHAPSRKKIVGVTDPRPCDELIDKSAIFPGE
jgi:hypothetical protein